MFDGSVEFRAEILGNGLQFPTVDFNPQHSNVDHISINAPNGREVVSTVFLKSVSTKEDGEQIAETANVTALDRLSFFYGVAIGTSRATATNFTPINPPPGTTSASTAHMMLMVQAALPVNSVNAAAAKATLESPSIPGSRYFGFFRSAFQSSGHVEKFMLLYNVLLLVLRDDQEAVDRFIVNEEPSVAQSRSARRSKRPIYETIYTRLRNEFAHARTGANINMTRQEMANHVDNLAGLVKKAIVQVT